jgi:hypothetical protein
MSALIWIGIILLCAGLALSQYKKIVTFILSIKPKTTTTDKLRKWKVKKEVQKISNKEVDAFVKKFVTPNNVGKVIKGVVPLLIGLGILMPMMQTVLTQVNQQYNTTSAMSPAISMATNTLPLIVVGIVIMAVLGILVSFGGFK